MSPASVRRRVAGIETNREAEGRVRRVPVPVQQPVHVPDGQLRLGKVRIVADGSRRGIPRARSHLEGRGIAVDRARGVDHRKAGPCERVVRIEPDRTLVLLDGLHVRRRRPPAFKVSRTEVRVVGVRILGLPARKAAHAIGRQPEANLLGDGCAQLLLQHQEALRLALVGLRPDVLLISHANERRGHAQLVAFSTNRTLQQIVHGQLLADLDRRLRGAFVAQRAALDAQPIRIDLSEHRAGLLGEARGQVGPVGIAPDVLEGQHRKRDACGGSDALEACPCNESGHHRRDQQAKQ